MTTRKIGPGECHDLIVALREGSGKAVKEYCEAAYETARLRKEQMLADAEARLFAKCTDPERARKMLEPTF